MRHPSLILYPLCLTTVALAQPVGEEVTRLDERIRALTRGNDAERLAAVRRIALHRHLFAGRNRSIARRAFGELVGKDELGQAAAVACYVGAGAPQPNDAENGPAWRISWATGLGLQLSQSGKLRLREELVSIEPLRRMWATFALARHRVVDTSVTKRLQEALATGTPDQRVLAARLLARRGFALAAIRRALEGGPADLAPHYCTAITDLAERHPEAFDAAIPLLRRGIGAAELTPRAIVLETLEKRPTLDLPRVRVLLALLEAVDDSGEGSFRYYGAEQLRSRAARRLGRVAATFEPAILADLRRQLRRPERNRPLYEVIKAFGSRAAILKEPLFARLTHADWREREQAAVAIGEIGDLHRADLQRLAGHLSDDQDGFRRAIAKTIASAGKRAAFLARSMHARVAAGDLQVAEGYGQLAAVSGEALGLLVAKSPPADPKARRSLAQAIGRSGRREDPRVIHWLTAALSSRDYPVLLAVQRLGAKDPRLIDAVTVLLRDARHDRALYAACCLTTLGCATERAIPVLLRYMRDDRSMSGKREIAIHGLVQCPDLDASIVVEIASRLYSHRTSRGVKRSFFHQRIAHALGKLGSAGTPAVPALLEALRSDGTLHLSARVEVLHTLGRISASRSEVIPVLLDNLGARTEYVKRAARRAVLGYGPAAVPVLERIAAGPDSTRATAARNFLAEIR